MSTKSGTGEDPKLEKKSSRKNITPIKSVDKAKSLERKNSSGPLSEPKLSPPAPVATVIKPTPNKNAENPKRPDQGNGPSR